jgi:hypothetical protein
VSARDLEDALRQLGVEAAVDPRGTLAVLVSDPELAGLADPLTRATVVRLARDHGFTHIAVELSPRRESREAVRRG